MSGSHERARSPTAEDLVTNLKSQGFFDTIRKRCLADVRSSPGFQNLLLNVDGLVDDFLKCQLPSSLDKKIELREHLRRQLRSEPTFQQGLHQMADSLLAQFASPDVIAPSIDALACHARKVEYQAWLKWSKRKNTLLPDPVKPEKPSEPLLSAPPQPPEEEEEKCETEENAKEKKPDTEADVRLSDDDVEMEIDDAGDEMDLGECCLELTCPACILLLFLTQQIDSSQLLQVRLLHSSSFL